MHRRALVASLLLVSSAFLLARIVPARAAQAPRAEDQLLQLVRDWLAAEGRNDHAALDRLFDDSFMGTAFGGNVISKSDVIPPEGASGENRFSKAALQDASVRLFGDTGIVMGRVAVNDPQPPGEFRCTLVFQKRADSWKVIAAHLSR